MVTQWIPLHWTSLIPALLISSSLRVIMPEPFRMLRKQTKKEWNQMEGDSIVLYSPVSDGYMAAVAPVSPTLCSRHLSITWTSLWSVFICIWDWTNSPGSLAQSRWLSCWKVEWCVHPSCCQVWVHPGDQVQAAGRTIDTLQTAGSAVCRNSYSSS